MYRLRCSECVVGGLPFPHRRARRRNGPVASRQAEMPPMAKQTAPADLRGELVIGLAGALGTRLDDLAGHVVHVLRGFDFECSRLRISDLLRRFPDWTECLERGE